MTVNIDMEVVERALSKEELQIFNILLGKVQDLEDFVNGWNTVDSGDDGCEHEYYYSSPPPPTYYVKLMFDNDSTTLLEDKISATSIENAVIEFYKKHLLVGNLSYIKDKDVWEYEGHPIQLERLDGDEY